MAARRAAENEDERNARLAVDRLRRASHRMQETPQETVNRHENDRTRHSDGRSRQQWHLAAFNYNLNHCFESKIGSMSRQCYYCIII
uniref:Uncharacterized protein n=1 Tax=Octopus bimaculoides TaxID=37653 RepID=A0A0L8FTN1_OCTBM